VLDGEDKQPVYHHSGSERLHEDASVWVVIRRTYFVILVTRGQPTLSASDSQHNERHESKKELNP